MRGQGSARVAALRAGGGSRTRLGRGPRPGGRLGVPAQLELSAVSTRVGLVGVLSSHDAEGREVAWWVGLGYADRDALEADAAAFARSAGSALRAARPARALAARLKPFADGRPCDLGDVPIGWEGTTPFQRAVIREARKLGWGETATYGELAARAGFPGAARAVGQVMSHNRVPLIVPCHRVVGHGGRLGGFSAPQGILLKERLLRQERRGADAE